MSDFKRQLNCQDINKGVLFLTEWCIVFCNKTVCIFCYLVSQSKIILNSPFWQTKRLCACYNNFCCLHCLDCVLFGSCSSVWAHRLLHRKRSLLCRSQQECRASRSAATQRWGVWQQRGRGQGGFSVCAHIPTQTQRCAVVMVSTALAPPYCKQRGGDRLLVLVNIISVIQQTWHCQRLAVLRHNQH